MKESRDEVSQGERGNNEVGGVQRYHLAPTIERKWESEQWNPRVGGAVDRERRKKRRVDGIAEGFPLITRAPPKNPPQTERHNCNTLSRLRSLSLCTREATFFFKPQFTVSKTLKAASICILQIMPLEEARNAWCERASEHLIFHLKALQMDSLPPFNHVNT